MHINNKQLFPRVNFGSLVDPLGIYHFQPCRRPLVVSRFVVNFGPPHQWRDSLLTNVPQSSPRRWPCEIRKSPPARPEGIRSRSVLDGIGEGRSLVVEVIKTLPNNGILKGKSQIHQLWTWDLSRQLVFRRKYWIRIWRFLRCQYGDDVHAILRCQWS